MELVESFLTNNPCWKAGKKIQVKGLMLHSVGCSQQSAESFVKKWNNPSSSRACVHAFIDGSTGKVYQTLPWNHRGWHAGGTANNTHIGVEMCEPSCIRYTSGANFICSDREAALKVAKCTYDAAVELFAMLCREFDLSPQKEGVIVSHKEGHGIGIASGHADPDHLWNGLQAGYTMDGFRRDVAAFMGVVPKSVDAPDLQLQNPAETETKSESLCSGDKVRLLPEAVYYNGKRMPEWVLSDIWIVKSIDGNRAVIDYNVSGSHAICSPVNVKYLQKV